MIIVPEWLLMLMNLPPKCAGLKEENGQGHPSPQRKKRRGCAGEAEVAF
jgi:hypothetical protein